MRKYVLPLTALLVILAGALTSFQRPATTAAKGMRSFLFLSDVHINTQSKSTAYGSDTGMDLWAAFLKKVDAILSATDAPDFIVYTGDLPAHYSCMHGCYLPPSARQGHDSDLRVILNGLNRVAAQHHKPIFYLPGNNDGLAGDYYSFADEQEHTPLSLIKPSALFFPNASPIGSIPGMVSDPHAALGFYSARPIPGLRLIALNTVIYSGSFQAVDGTTQQSDGNVQLQWLAAQLAEAHVQNEKVYIAMHIPPGTDAYSTHNMWTNLPGNENWQNAFLSLTGRYRATIAGILYGHTHMDELRRLYDSSGKQITQVAISCPGVTPQHYNNPGFKVVQYDAVSKGLMDFTTYFTLPTASKWGDSTYTFSKVFGCKPGTSMLTCLSGMQSGTVDSLMNLIYTVHHGAPSYPTGAGIEVMWQQ